MARVYLTGSGPTKGYVTGSGIISNPARILLHERDNRTGSYPTIARTGDVDFTGAYRSFYDDTDSINFVGNSRTVYPTALPSSSKWVSGGIDTPNILQGLTTVGTASKGIADAHVSFTPGENISPFNESRIYIDNDSAFYQTGTNSSILPGFNQRLSSKTVVSLDINPSSRTDVFFSTGSVAAGKSVNSGMVYFNWYSKKWEIVGNLSTGSNIDIFNPSPTIRSAAIHPAVGIPQFLIADPLSVSARHMGRFHSTHGFPFATQYNSTGSQELLLTGVLSGPFLLEKAVLEWSGSFASANDAGDDGPLCYQFFLLNVSPVSDSVTIVQDLTGSATGVPPFTIRNSTFTVTQVKDLVWSGEIARIETGGAAGSDGTGQNGAYLRDLSILGGASTNPAITGTFKVEAPATIYGRNDGLTIHATRDQSGAIGANQPLLANKIGFRNFGGFVEGKSLIKPISAINPSGSFTTLGTGIYKIDAIPTKDIKAASPYVLLPNHKLVLGFYGVPIQGTGLADQWSEAAAAKHVTTLSPGLGRLTLYGSLLRDGLPSDSESNQPLTSDAIHEDLHYDNPVYDQFDVEPFETFRNSYSDLIITGSMLATPLGSSTAAGVRKVQGLVTSGQAGTTGSLQRFVNLISESDVMYDSFPPNPVDIISEKVGGGFVDYISEYRLTVASPRSQYASFTGIDSNWYMRTAYEVNSNRFVSVNYDLLSKPAYDLTGLQTSAAANLTFPKSLTILSSEDDLIPIIPGMDSALIYIVADSLGSRTSDQAGRLSLKALFGFGKSKYNIPNLQTVSKNLTGFVVTSSVEIRGYKYGLAGIFGNYTSARFRRDHYGQFRDMLEQSPNAAYLVANSVEYPLEVKFFSRQGKNAKGQETTDPAQTHTQNLSNFATSSLPYFDGVARERTDDPDITVEPLQLS